MFRFERDSDSRSPLRIKSLAQLTSYPASEIPHICGDKSYGRAFGDDLGGLTPELSRPARCDSAGPRPRSGLGLNELLGRTPSRRDSVVLRVRNTCNVITGEIRNGKRGVLTREFLNLTK